jgi:transposase
MPVPNYLKMHKRQQVLALLELGWTYRRIETETGVRRETVSRYDRLRRGKAAKVFPGSAGASPPVEADPPGPDPANPAKVFPGSESNAAKAFPGSGLPPRSSAAAYHDAIVEKLNKGLTRQRVWQDLVEEFGYAHSYESVKRYIRTLRRDRRVAGVIHSAPGEEGQVDFFQGVATFNARTGRWQRPWVFRMTLGHSRHGYEEAVWDQKIESFLRLHENAFRDFGGVPTVLRHDNLKSAVVRACLYDPDMNEVYAAFARHYGFTPLPIRPRNPRENGKQERSGGYVKDNALKGRRFDSLEAKNAYLRHWNRTVARLRIHGTTRRQVYTHFLETDRPALQPLPAEPFALFACGDRKVHPDGHVEVDGAFYPAPAHLLGLKIQVRFDQRLVRLYHDQVQVAVHTRVAAGTYAPRPGQNLAHLLSSQGAFLERLLGRCERVGPELRLWAEAAFEERGVRAFRLLQGALNLTRTHPKEALLHAARLATAHRLFRYRDLRRLTSQAPGDPRPRTLLDTHPSIRPLTHYRLEEFL